MWCKALGLNELSHETLGQRTCAPRVPRGQPRAQLCESIVEGLQAE
jgi:hypothetical protein